MFLNAIILDSGVQFLSVESFIGDMSNCGGLCSHKNNNNIYHSYKANKGNSLTDTDQPTVIR